MRKIVIFGATSAIAMATAKLFAKDGDAFVLVARSENKLESVRNDLLTRGAKEVYIVAADLADMNKHEALLEQLNNILEDFDTVFVAYGSLGDQEASEKDFSVAETEIRTNFLSVVSLLTSIANSFEEKQRGSIAVISSVAGDRGRQSNYIYGAAKGALSLFLGGLRNRLHKNNVHVLTIKPGFVDTPMTADCEKGPLFVSADVVGKGIYQAIQNKKDVVYLPFFWILIMFIIKSIPELIFKRLKL